MASFYDLRGYAIIDLKEIACDTLLYHDNPSAVVLSILCDFQGKEKQTVVNTILQRLKALTGSDEREYNNYLKKVNVLSSNRDLTKEIRKGMKMFTVDIRETPMYQIAEEYILDKNLQEGIVKGRKEGISKGRKEGEKNATFANAVLMMEKLNHSMDDIVKVLNIKKEELIEYMNTQKEKQ